MIHSFKYCIKSNKDIGRVKEIKGPLVYVDGFVAASIGEGVTFESGLHGQILSVNKGVAEVILFSRLPINFDEKVGRTGSQLSISVGEGLLGHVINSLGYTLDDRREDSIVSKPQLVESKAPGISERKKVDKFLETGVSVVDLMVPLGLGQRELVMGDRKTGKTSFLLQAVLAQAKKGRTCIYTLIGKKKSEIKEIRDYLKKNEVLDHSIIIAASSEDSPGENYIAPFSAMAIAEYFKDSGIDSLVIYDDLSAHARYYREISLMGGRFPGRESYPGDIFYLHSKLLERAGNFKNASITCLPVAEAPSGDISGYIQTNLMSMTDGHLFFDSDLFYKGLRPAVNIFLSVTRVGKQTQQTEVAKLAVEAMLLMKKSEEMSRFLRFGSEITPQVDEVLRKGKAILDFFNQMPGGLRSFDKSVNEIKKILGSKPEASSK